jgi:glutamate racemase
VISQGEIVADSLADYLHRHPELESRCSRQGRRRFCTTDSTADFEKHATAFYGTPLQAEHVDLGV